MRIAEGLFTAVIGVGVGRMGVGEGGVAQVAGPRCCEFKCSSEIRGCQ